MGIQTVPLEDMEIGGGRYPLNDFWSEWHAAVYKKTEVTSIL